MVTIHINDDLGKQLQLIAEKEAVSVDQIAETLIQQYVDTKQTVPLTSDNSRNLFALILEASDQLDLRSGRSDISENSNEITRKSMGRYLKQRMQGIEADEQ